MANATVAKGSPGEIVRLGKHDNEKTDSLLKLRIRRFFKHRMAVLGVLLLRPQGIFVGRAATA